jgi:hypothetical protein
MRWADGRVAVEDAVVAPRPLSGAWLRDRYFASVPAITRGLIRWHDGALWLGPLELIRFGEPQVGEREVSWPIAGGLLAASPGGRFQIESAGGSLMARVEDYRPSLPRTLYAATQLQVHHALVRLQLLRLRGRTPAPGVPADPARRMTAGAIDAAVCLGLVFAVARRRPMGALLGVAAGYHVACWSTSGRTLGGLLMRQRVVAVDGSRPSVTQSLLRFVALPLAAFRLRAIHDEIAATDVVED